MTKKEKLVSDTIDTIIDECRSLRMKVDEGRELLEELKQSIGPSNPNRKKIDESVWKLAPHELN